MSYRSFFPLWGNTPGYYVISLLCRSVVSSPYGAILPVIMSIVLLGYCYGFWPLQYLYKMVVGIWLEYRPVYVFCSVCLVYFLVVL